MITSLPYKKKKKETPLMHENPDIQKMIAEYRNANDQISSWPQWI